jgi:hypothetical protein
MNIKTGNHGQISNDTLKFQIILWNMMTEKFIETSMNIAVHLGINDINGEIMKKAIIYESLSSDGIGQMLKSYFEDSINNNIDFEHLPLFIKEKALANWDNLPNISQNTSSKNMSKIATNYIINNHIKINPGDNNNEGDENNQYEGYENNQYEGYENNQDEGDENNQDEGDENNQDEGDENNQDEGDENNQDEGDENNQDEGDENNQDEGDENNQDEGDENNQDEGDEKCDGDCDFCEQIKQLEVFIKTWKPTTSLEKMILNAIKSIE